MSQKRDESGVSTSSMSVTVPVDQAELELGVGQDDAALTGVVATGLVDADRVARAAGLADVGTYECGERVEVDVLVVPDVGLGGRA